MEFITISAINDFLLPPFIFLVTFCFLCCQVAEPGTKNETTVQENKSANSLSSSQVTQDSTRAEPPKKTEVIEDQIEKINHSPESQEADTAKEIKVCPNEELVNEKETEEEVLPAGSEKLEILTKRQARKLMSALKLQQKRNGVELSTELMKANLKREFRTNPQKVIEAIKRQLPELKMTEAGNNRANIKAAS